MFDRSELLGGEWLKEELPQAPARWVQINVGLEETTLPLDALFPGAEGKTLDLYNPAVMTEPAVTRAKQQKADVAALAVEPESLPVENGWADLVVVTLAAHEIRDGRKRERFFHELRRIASPEGQSGRRGTSCATLPRRWPSAPGSCHFFPRSEWLRLGSRVSLEVERERRITPFVRAFVYRCLKAASECPGVTHPGGGGRVLPCRIRWRISNATTSRNTSPN